MVGGVFSLPANGIGFVPFPFFVKILILTALYPPLGANGHDDRCRQIVGALSARGHHLQVLTSNYRMPPMGVNGEKGVFRQLMLHDEGSASGASYRSLYEQQLEDARVLYHRIDRFEPDVVYVWNMDGLSKSLLLGLQEQGISMVYDLHTGWLMPKFFDNDPWFSWWKRGQGLGRTLHQRYLRMTGSAWRHLRHFPVGQASDLDLSNATVCSVSLREVLVAAGVSRAASLPVVYPALDANHLLFEINYQPARKFMWAGRLNAAKAPGIALRAVGVLKERGIDVSLDFYGMGEPLERKAMRNLIDASGLSDSVRMLGIRQGELVSKYADYDALLFTSRCNDPFPITPLEAMLSGLPCVLARDGGIAEVVKDGETALLYDAGDAEALADAMVRMMALEDGGAAMAKNCMESLQAQHSLDTVIHRIEALLDASVQS
jgi:glycosyltransferase involved in cell wall biosynthesis